MDFDFDAEYQQYRSSLSPPSSSSSSSSSSAGITAVSGTGDAGGDAAATSVLTAVVLLLVVPLLLYVYTASVAAARFPTLRNKRVCLLIAHPDDEAMFFAPTVLALARAETGNHVKILCLSSGNAEGLGEIRRTELVKSAMTLGLRAEEDVFVLDDPEFPDSMTAQWSSSAISALLCRAFAPHLAPTGSGTSPSAPGKRPRPSSAASSAAGAPSASIDVLVTFDAHGVSSHPNHVSCYRGARDFVAQLVRGREGFAPPVDLYTLGTVPIWRKYLSFWDAPATLLAWWWAATGGKKRAGGGGKEHPGALVFVSNLVGGGGGVRGVAVGADGRTVREGAGAGGTVFTAWKAMVTAHKSQMVWFRWGWIVFSRYMYMNDLRLEKIV